VDNIVNAPLYSLGIFEGSQEVFEAPFNCLTDDEITIAESDPTLEETDTAET